MKTDELDDLKQFMTALISQTEIRLEERMGSLISELRTEMHDGFVGITDIIDTSNKQLVMTTKNALPSSSNRRLR